MSDLATRTLADCEAIIERGLGTFVEVGDALTRIRDERLYRESHGTFEDYCRERWGMTPQHGGRLIAAASVAASVAALEPNGSTPAPASEAVARELAPLRAEPEALREVWTEAVEQHGPAPTAKQVREVVEERKPRATSPPSRDVHAEFAAIDPAVATAVAVRDSNTVLARIQQHIFDLRRIDIAACTAVLDASDRDQLERLTTDCDRALGEIAALRDAAAHRLQPIRRVS